VAQWIPKNDKRPAEQNRDETSAAGTIIDTVEYLKALRRVNQGETAAPGSAPRSAGTQQAPSLSGCGSEGSLVSERRIKPRYRCQGSVEFRSAGSEVRSWATITDISRGGCYAEIQSTVPVGTDFDMVVQIAGSQVRTKGVVRVSYPFLGMGIAFTDISPANRIRLDEIVTRLAEAAVRQIDAAGSEIDFSQVSNPGAVLKSLGIFFRSNKVLTRSEFSEMIAQAGDEKTLR